ncbi:serine/threonine protein kinase [Nocardiopsis eucommiae]|uniref:serine/threonine protein kinase n=1 Tax=Nocardiopsis eucommiae TaxID=2831970 RepID=UPI003D753317
MDFSLPDPPPNVNPLTDGDPLQVGGYRVIGRLGADGVSTLFAAVSPDHEPTALRIAGPGWDALAVDGTPTAERSDGVCAVGVRDLGTHEGRPWSAIEYLPGLGLREHVRLHGPVGGDALLALAAGMAEALATTHATGAVHGDLRPESVVSSARGPRVLDFGIARRIDDTASVQSGTSLGWLSPERYDGAPATQRSDVHAWACLVVFAATGEPPFGASPAGHTPGRVPGQILWEMARRTREARVDLRALPEELRSLLLRAFSPDPELRPSAEDAYLECLLMLGIDEQSTADTWPDQLRALIARHWPIPDLSWHDPERWVRSAHAPAQAAAGTGDGGAETGAVASVDGATASEGAAVGPGTLRGETTLGGGAETGADDEEWGPEAAAEAYGHALPAPTADGPGAPPGARGAGTAGRGGADYLFGPSQTGGHDLSGVDSGGIDLDEDDGAGSRGRVGLWLAVGAAGMVAVLGGGYLLVNALSESPADTVVSEGAAEEPAASEDEEETEEGAAAPTELPCDDAERRGAQSEHAPWRPFTTDTVSPDSYAPLLVPGPEGEPNTSPDVWPFVSPLDHDTMDFGLVTPSLEAFPVMSVCMTGARDTGAGVEFTAELTYHPTVGSHRVYEEDFLALTPLDPELNGGIDKETVRGGSGSELGQPMTTLTELSPQHPFAEITVLLPGAPERAGVAYRPSEYAGALVHDLSGHCYDVDGTEEWRDGSRLGSGYFALPSTVPGESDMTLCPVDGAPGQG